MRPFITDRKIEAAQFTSKWVTPGDMKALARKLIGRKILSIGRRGKYILIQLDEGVLTMHLGMTGKLLVQGSVDEHTHGVFGLSHAKHGEGVLLYHDPRQFGSIEWSPAENPRVTRLGPEPLDISFDEFLARFKGKSGVRKVGMKALLLNQAFLAGLGNIYADESLFAAGIHPLTSAAKIASPRSRARAERLYQAIRAILSRAIEVGGSSISDYVNAEGERGWFQIEHKVYGREGEPCANCGGPIRKVLVAQRGTHFCPRCQKK